MKTILFYSAVTIFVLCGCTERSRQKALSMGGDPALATDSDMKELKADVAEMKKSIEEIKYNLKH